MLTGMMLNDAISLRLAWIVHYGSSSGDRSRYSRVMVNQASSILAKAPNIALNVTQLK